MKRILSFVFVLVLASSAVLPAADRTGTASVTITVPVGATLTINGHPTHQMTGTRLFVTPDLAVGKKYRYIFEATYTWFGEEVVKKKQLDLTVGASYTVDMTLGETVKKPVVVDEPEQPVVPVKNPEPKKPDPPKPEPRLAPPVEPKRSEPSTMPKPSPPAPEPKKPDPPKPSAVIPEPQRPLAPKPREVKPKTGT